MRSNELKTKGEKFEGKPCVKCGCIDARSRAGCCKKCACEYQKIYVEKNKEKIRAYQKDYYIKHRVEHNERSEKWKELNPEKARESKTRSSRKRKDIKYYGVFMDKDKTDMRRAIEDRQARILTSEEYIT